MRSGRYFMYSKGSKRASSGGGGDGSALVMAAAITTEAPHVAGTPSPVVLSWDIGQKNLNYCLLTVGGNGATATGRGRVDNAPVGCVAHQHPYRILAHETINLGDASASVADLRWQLVCALRERPLIWSDCPPHTVVVVEQQVCVPGGARRRQGGGGGGALVQPTGSSSSFKNQAIQQMVAILYESLLGRRVASRQARYKYGGHCALYHTSNCLQIEPVSPPEEGNADHAACGSGGGGGRTYRQRKRQAGQLFNHILPVGSPGRLPTVAANALPDYADSALQGIRALNEQMPVSAAAAAAKRHKKAAAPHARSETTSAPTNKRRRRRLQLSPSSSSPPPPPLQLSAPVVRPPDTQALQPPPVGVPLVGA